MAKFFVERGRLVQIIKRTIDFDTLKALFAQLGEFFAIFPLSVAHDGRQQIAARALLHGHDPVDHILHLLGFNRQTRFRRKWRANPREQKPHIVINFCHRAHCRAGIFRGGFLLNGDGRTQTADVINIRFFHHIQKLPRIGRQAFNVAPLPLCIDRVKGQRRFSRT